MLCQAMVMEGICVSMFLRHKCVDTIPRNTSSILYEAPSPLGDRKLETSAQLHQLIGLRHSQQTRVASQTSAIVAINPQSLSAFLSRILVEAETSHDSLSKPKVKQGTFTMQ